MASLTVSEKVKIMPSIRQQKDNERNFRTIVQQLVSSIPREVLTNTSYKRKEQGNDIQKKTVTFDDQQKEDEEVIRSLEQVYSSGRRTVRREGEFRIKTRDKKICPGSLI